MRKMTSYTSEFRREAVKLAQSSNKPTNQIAQELGVKAKTLYSWIATAMKEKISHTRKTEPKSKHHAQELEHENKQLKKWRKRKIVSEILVQDQFIEYQTGTKLC